MHQLNKSQSPLHLRSQPSQGSFTGLPFDTRPMRKSALVFANASIRQIVASRRGRPAATSIADFFVRSLVIAGYCQEHSPRDRHISSFSIKASAGGKRNWEGRSMWKSSRRPQSGTSPSVLSRIDGIGIHHLRTQRMLNSSVAQRVPLCDPDDHRIGQSATHQSLLTTPPEYDIRQGEDARSSSRRETGPDQPPYTNLPDESQRRVLNGEIAHETDTSQEPNVVAHRINTRMSAAKKLYQDVSEIYQALFEGKLSWKEAADAVAAFQQFPPRFDKTESAAEYNAVRKLEEYLWDNYTSNHYIFTLYRELPFPGVMHLSKRARGALLRRFADPPDRRWVDARRFLALVEDMLTARLPLTRSLWTSAIHLAGRSKGKLTSHDLMRVIGLWNQMEHTAGIKSDNVVFTVLFDIAIKADQYTVAERLLEEMDRRNLQFGRHGKITKIFYYGLLGDADGVCQAFDEFVKSGELVDTAVVNCLMVSFIRAGELDAAKTIYSQLLQTKPPKYFASEKLVTELPSYRKTANKFARVLQASASLKRKLPEHHRVLQEALVLSPDTRTFHIFLSHYARKLGSMRAFESVVSDMEKIFRVPPRGMIYLLLFEGFAHHGRHRRDWNADRLSLVWKAYLRALHESKTRVEHRSFALPPSFTWENPLRQATGSAPSVPTPAVPTGVSNKLLVPLFSAARSAKYDDFYDMEEDEDDLSIDIELGDVNSTLDPALEQERPREDNSIEALEHRLENGVFLGRSMIITILRAFGACCGPEEIMAAWLRMESVWQPEKRKALDVMAVQGELEKQLERVNRRIKYGVK